jgi:hypothetical protein
MTPLQEDSDDEQQYGSYYERKYEEWYDPKCDFRPLPNRLAPVEEIEEILDLSEFLPDLLEGCELGEPVDMAEMPFELMFDPASEDMTRFNLQTYYAADDLYRHMPTIFLEDLIDEQVKEFFSPDK